MASLGAGPCRRARGAAVAAARVAERPGRLLARSAAKMWAKIKSTYMGDCESAETALERHGDVRALGLRCLDSVNVWNDSQRLVAVRGERPSHNPVRATYNPPYRAL